jgi:hypothetical protein
MSALFRSFVLAVLGLVFAIFGVFHAVTSYPDPNAFATVTRELPALGTVASFGFGIAAAMLGLILLVPSLIRLRGRRVSQRPAYPGPRSPYSDRGMPAIRPTPPQREEEYDPDAEDFAGDEYRGGSGGRHHDNGEYEQRRRAALYR